ncbi:hypothetical protein AB1Y20_019672 [Prymnesium parvum]|uniref:Phospholipase/carboxylesterase/thioesterase domain-containing protein n=1 Tax=Prymnesium parvum TaxID=97485 RepID=A0AB34JVL6_PRYPA|mmetsp:Transcript_21859/g.54500  ORF Transcript_21859/g.54500 Transcript_21859/m.54500 type:complete len:369 (-) Transcript_21859:578-1684(-)
MHAGRTRRSARSLGGASSREVPARHPDPLPPPMAQSGSLLNTFCGVKRAPPEDLSQRQLRSRKTAVAGHTQTTAKSRASQGVRPSAEEAVNQPVPRKRVALTRVVPLRPTRVTAEDPGELVILPTEAHTHTVILLHGMYCAPEDNALYNALPAYLGFLGVRSIKFVFPRAPRRTVTWPTGPEANVLSWYNYFTRRDGCLEHDEIDQAHLESQSRRVHAILDREAQLLGGDVSRIVLGGTSQGGTVSLHAAISYGRPLGGLLCLRSCLVETVTVPRDRRSAVCKTPVFVFVCGEDSVYAPPLVARGYSLLEASGYHVEWHVEPRLIHWEDCRNELRCVASWIYRVANPRALRAYADVLPPTRSVSPETC